jgi:dTDP-4-amino-4,6-dideoxygalactose transaminase
LSNKVNYWTGGQGKLFEQEFAHFSDSRYAIALANGTVALDLALKALGVGEGDEVIVTPRTFIASVSSVVNSGATPIFADVDRDSQCLTADTIAEVISDRAKAIVVVHLAGMPADMDSIMALANKNGIYVIEDCAQAHGAKYKGRSVGSIGHVGAWSFCQDKIMSTGGEGGMVTTDDEQLWRFMQSYKDHGKNHEVMSSPRSGSGFRWVHDSFGTNFRMTEMQAAIGRIQLKKMAYWHPSRLENARKVWRAAESICGIRSVVIPNHSIHAAYKSYVFVEPESLKLGWDRDRIIAEIIKYGVPCFSGSCSEVYREKAFLDSGLSPDVPLPIAQELGETSIMFLVHPTLTDQELDKTCSVFQQVMADAVI